MNLLKKVVLAIIISCSIFYIVPTVMPISKSIYTVQAAKIKLNTTKYKMNKGEKYTLKVKGTKKKVKWSTSNKKVATVNSKGKVTAKKKGTVTITAKVGSKKYKCKITVEAPSISKTKYTLNINKTYTLKIKGTSQKIKWSTSNKKIVTVNSNGKVTAKSKGTATIIAKVGNSKYNCKITVKDPTIYADFNGKTFTLKEDETMGLFITNTTQKVAWSTSDKNVVSIDCSDDTLDCWVEVLKPGTATITAKVANKVFSCKIVIPDFRDNFELTTKESHYSDDTTPVVVAYLKNKTNKAYEVLVSITYYDSNKNEILEAGEYINVGAKSIFACPFGFQHQSYDDYDSYKIEMERALERNYNINNKISCKLETSYEKYWNPVFTNNSGKTLYDTPEYTVIGYNEKGGINFYYKDKGYKDDFYNRTTSSKFNINDGWKNGNIIIGKGATFTHRYYNNYEDVKVFIPTKFEIYAQCIEN